MDIKEIRVLRLKELLASAEIGGKQTLLSKRIRKAPAQISQWINGTRTIREESAREIEAAAKLPPGWLDRPHDLPADDAAISSVVFSELLQRLPEAERHLIVTVAYHTLHRNEALFASEDLSRYDAALQAFQPPPRRAN